MRYLMLILCIFFFTGNNDVEASYCKKKIEREKVIQRPVDHYYSYYRFHDFLEMLDRYNREKRK